MKVILVDDHELIREGLKKVLKKHNDVELVGEAKDTAKMFFILEQNEVDVIVLDISLPGRSGLDVLKEIKDRYPKTKILILSMHPEDRFAIRALRAGAAGYLTKESAANDLITALRKVNGGGKFVSQKLAEKLLDTIDKPMDKPLHDSLSNRELEVMLMIAVGKSVGDIAQELSLSVNTITSYRSRIMDKMNMKSNAEIVRYALENQLIN